MLFYLRQSLPAAGIIEESESARGEGEVGLAVSLLHRFGIDEKHDPYNLIETLPLRPGAPLDVDTC